MKQIPNLFTLLNLVCGCIAIICILQTGEMLVTQNDEGSWITELPEKIWFGSLFIGIAAVIDFLDGFIARLFKATSEMGKQLDSLADVVSFGVAPGLIFYQLLRLSYMQEPDAMDIPVMALLPAVIFPCSGAWRLARFNISTTNNNYFQGVPIPAAGLFVASLPVILFYNEFEIARILLNKWFLYLLIFVVSWLMVSKWRFISLKFNDRSVAGNMPKIILAVVAILAALFLHWLAVPLVFVIYILISFTSKKTVR